MKHKLLVSLLLAAFPCVASIIPCASDPVNVVTTLGAGNGCTIGSITEENYSLDFSSNFTSVVVGIVGADFVGAEADTHYSIITDPVFVGPHGPNESFWVSMNYEVEATGPWMDMVDLHNIDGAGVLMKETVCASDPALNYGQCPDADLLGVGDASEGEDTIIRFAAAGKLFINKWMAFSDATITHFDNGVGAPEPATEAMFGGGLVALCLFLKRRVK
jgi:hypothetical protein